MQYTIPNLKDHYARAEIARKNAERRMLLYWIGVGLSVIAGLGLTWSFYFNYQQYSIRIDELSTAELIAFGIPAAIFWAIPIMMAFIFEGFRDNARWKIHMSQVRIDVMVGVHEAMREYLKLTPAEYLQHVEQQELLTQLEDTAGLLSQAFERTLQSTFRAMELIDRTDGLRTLRSKAQRIDALLEFKAAIECALANITTASDDIDEASAKYIRDTSPIAAE